jgi:hypothetical protein
MYFARLTRVKIFIRNSCLFSFDFQYNFLPLYGISNPANLLNFKELKV